MSSTGKKYYESNSNKCSCIFKLLEQSPSQLNQQKANSNSNVNYISPAQTRANYFAAFQLIGVWIKLPKSLKEESRRVLFSKPYLICI